MSDLFTVAHVAQLNEIQASRLRRNQPGIGRHVEELIRRLTDGGVAGKLADNATAQAKRLWDLGVGTELGFRTFLEYSGTIPEIPEALRKDDAEFPFLVLVEPCLGLKSLCYLGGIRFAGDDDTFVAYDGNHREFVRPTWIRIQDGRKDINISVRDCRKSFGKRERGLTALQGVCAYLQHPQVVSEATLGGAHIMDLSGSVHRDYRADAAFLGVWSGQPRLDWLWGGDASPKCGSASRREC